jgi:undecaprenyl-phosphate 4-deoxy-4-formamido-L-arabinose transferase
VTEGMSITEAGSISIVVPIYNEEASIAPLLERCLTVCTRLGRPFEIVLVDDGSRDSSPACITAAAREHAGRVLGVLLTRNYGQHAAVMAGFSECRGDVVITLDADLQNPPEEIPKLVAKMDEGYDVVGSVRESRRDSAFRRLSSWLVNRSVRSATGVAMHDYGCMLRAYRRPIVEAMLQCNEHSTFIPVLANTFAQHTAEVPVRHAERRDGTSRYDIWKLMRLQFDLLTSMTIWPLRILMAGGTVIALAGVGFGVFLLLMRLIRGSEWAAQGVFTLFAVLFIFIGGQFMALGLLGEYIGRIYQARARPWYFVRTVVGREHAAPPHAAGTTKAPDVPQLRLHVP